MSPALAGGFFTTSTAWEAPSSRLLLLNTSLLTWVGRCWRRSLRRHDCKVTGDLGPGNLRLFTPPGPWSVCFPTPSTSLDSFQDKAQTWGSNMLLRQSMWLNQGKDTKETCKTPVGGRGSLCILRLPRTSLVCEFPCLLNLPPTSLEWWASFFGLFFVQENSSGYTQRLSVLMRILTDKLRSIVMKFQNIKETEKDLKASERKKPMIGIYKRMRDKLAKILNNTGWEMTAERCLKYYSEGKLF